MMILPATLMMLNDRIPGAAGMYATLPGILGDVTNQIIAAGDSGG